MKRTRTAAVVAALGLTLALTGAAVARNPHAGTHGGGNGATKTHTHGSTRSTKTADRTAPTTAPAAATLWVSGNTSHPGGTFRIVGLVQAPVASRPDSVDAIVHFASGDANVSLTHNGNGHGVAYHGTAVVPDAEPAGKVAIDVTATLGTQALTGTGWGAVVATDAPDATDTTDAAESPEPSETPEASESPEPSETPDASEGPDATDAGDVEQGEDAQGDENDGGDESGQPQLSPDAVRALIAYLQTLIG